MNIPIFLSSDNNYAPYMAATIVSIVENTDSFINFYILDGGISDENIEKISSMGKNYDNCSLEFIKIDVEKIFFSMKDDNKGCPHVTLSTFNRFLIPDLKPDLKKVIYLDTDIIANGDIKRLYEQDLGQYALGAVPGQMLEISEKCINRLELSKSHKYFNAGVLLIDLEKFRNQNIIKQLFEIEETQREKIIYVDQDILNIYFDNNYLELDKIYNYEAWNNDCDDYVLRHYTILIKPWYIHPELACVNAVKNLELFWKYINKTPFYNEIMDNCKYKTPSSLIKALLSISQNTKST